MNTNMRPIDRKTVTIWTPWGAQILDREETTRSGFRKRLELRRQREDRQSPSTKEKAVQN